MTVVGIIFQFSSEQFIYCYEIILFLQNMYFLKSVIIIFKAQDSFLNVSKFISILVL